MAPLSYIGLSTMLMLHGFLLDVIIIGVLPFLDLQKADSSRKALFPWALGGYEGFGSGEVPNLAPTHRRFIAENAAYAVLRGVPGIVILYSGFYAMPVLLMAVFSHFIEAVTIAWGRPSPHLARCAQLLLTRHPSHRRDLRIQRAV